MMVEKMSKNGHPVSWLSSRWLCHLELQLAIFNDNHRHSNQHSSTGCIWKLFASATARASSRPSISGEVLIKKWTVNWNCSASFFGNRRSETNTHEIPCTKRKLDEWTATNLSRSLSLCLWFVRNSYTYLSLSLYIYIHDYTCICD